MLQDALLAVRKAGEAKRSPDVVAAMHRAIAELRTSGALERVAHVGDMMPAFSLRGQHGVVDSAALLARGPLIVNFYRGKW